MLNFSNLDQAFILGSNQIKDTQEEIDQLTKLILQSNKKKEEPQSSKKETETTLIL